MRLAVITATLLLQSSRAPAVIGKQRAQLMSADVAAIAALVADRGPLWMVEVGGTTESLIVTAYLKPNRTGSEIRRGLIATLSKGRSASMAEARPWIISEATAPRAHEYAQVPLAGREADEVLDVMDENRPFEVVGNFSDEDLLSIVRLVRGARIARGPILRVTREAEGATVPVPDAARLFIMMRGLPECYDIVTLQRLRGAWQQSPIAAAACP